ncbi:HK97 gp10 family phage protein [Paenibacillus oenotherae]|uniref:HK97 gp10 family phage protein n=2 Tax=Paenibacillus oenotherae TaxID=1435645 RepID=A0ABS7D839_9BACL|nr:HK97 gp10 family phage protein [Paenibacillus oenotherae]
MRELQRLFQRLGRVPQSAATRGARAGARIALRAAKAKAPVDLGDLKRGIIMKAERRVRVGKKVYDIMMDPAKSDIFAKTSLAGKRSYYPASQEYGWMMQSGQYIPGYRYLRRAIDDNAQEIKNKTLSEAAKDIDRLLNRGR